MASESFMQRIIAAASILASGLFLAAAGCDLGVSGDPGDDDPGDDNPGSYTPYAEVSLQAITNAPFPAPAFSRPSFRRRRFNVADFGAVGDGITKNTTAFA